MTTDKNFSEVSARYSKFCLAKTSGKFVKKNLLLGIFKFTLVYFGNKTIQFFNPTCNGLLRGVYIVYHLMPDFPVGLKNNFQAIPTSKNFRDVLKRTSGVVPKTEMFWRIREFLRCLNNFWKVSNTSGTSHDLLASSVNLLETPRNSGRLRIFPIRFYEKFYNVPTRAFRKF